ncbi:aspartic peptidase domain-containing protein [Cerioporus squamosus]|nr:aspartic peptidase domain-containing protein [Cerioporus squamosus]
MGLALPANSLIAQQIPPTESDVPDGACISSNLFSITPISTAPGARFFGLALERPGSSRIPSVLGIGKHPPDVVPDPSKVEYANVIASSGNGPQWWQASVRGINVYVNGVKKPVSLPQSASGLSTPTAILDSGVPLIITTNAIANGIYGALGISPAADGNYYLPCTTPINMTIQLDGRTEIPIHPLDMSYFPPNDATSENCIGVIQTPSQFPGLQLQLTDMILGVPFLRNTYTVLAYDPPFENGSFPTNSANGNVIENVRPRLGLMNLTDPAAAADEFHTVRVLKQPLGSAVKTPASHGKGLSVGVEVLIGLLGFFGLCFALFGARWAYMRRKFNRERAAAAALEAADPYAPDKSGPYVFNDLGYQLTPMKTSSSGSGPTEDELRQKRFESYKRRQRSNMDSSYTDDTATTRVGSYFEYEGNGKADEFGKLSPTPGIPDTPDTPQRGYFDPWGDTVGEDRRATLVENPADFDAALAFAAASLCAEDGLATGDAPSHTQRRAWGGHASAFVACASSVALGVGSGAPCAKLGGHR